MKQLAVVLMCLPVSPALAPAPKGEEAMRSPRADEGDHIDLKKHRFLGWQCSFDGAVTWQSAGGHIKKAVRYYSYGSDSEECSGEIDLYATHQRLRHDRREIGIRPCEETLAGFLVPMSM